MSVKLSPRSTFFLVVALCLIGVLLWYFLFYSTRNQMISDTQTQLDDANRKLVTYRDAQSALPALRTEVAGLQVQRDAFFQALPQTQNIGSVVAAIRSDVDNEKGNLDSLTVSPGATGSLPAGVRPISMNLSVTARFQPTFKLLRSLETMSRFSNLNNVSLTLPAPDSSDPTLNSSMVLTVYTFDPASAATPSGTPAAPAAPATNSGSTPATPPATTPPSTPPTPGTTTPAAPGGIR